MKWCCRQTARYSWTTEHQGYRPKFPPKRTHHQKTGSLEFWLTRGSSQRQLLKVQLFFEISFILKIQLVLWFHHQMHFKKKTLEIVAGKVFPPRAGEWTAAGRGPQSLHPGHPLPSWCHSIAGTRANAGRNTAGRLHRWDGQGAGGTGDSFTRVKSRCLRPARQHGMSWPDDTGLSSSVKDATTQTVTFVSMKRFNAQVSQSCSTNSQISPRGARSALYLASAGPWNTICWVSRFWKLSRH